MPTKCVSEDKIEAEEAWNAMGTGHGDVAIDPGPAAERGLPSTIVYPRDPSILLYIIEAYHAIHCIVCDSSFHY